VEWAAIIAANHLVREHGKWRVVYKVDRTGCTLHEESSNAKMRTRSIIFIAVSCFKHFTPNKAMGVLEAVENETLESRSRD
jgi:hypothetical protein